MIQGNASGRPSITCALLRSGEAEALVVSKLDRLSRSRADAARLLELVSKQARSVVAIDPDIDTTTPTGGLVASIIASVSQWECKMIGLRIRQILAEAKRADMQPGRTLATVARGLNDDLVPRPGNDRIWLPGFGRSHPKTDSGSLCINGDLKSRATLRNSEASNIP